jgi:hypothetical protein
MNFTDLKALIKKESTNSTLSFEDSSMIIQNKIFSLNKKK